MSTVNRSHVPKSLSDHNFVTQSAQDMVEMTAISYLVQNKLVASKAEATQLVKNSDSKLTVNPEGDCTVRRIVHIPSSEGITVTGEFVVGKTVYCIPKKITVERK